MIVVEYLNMITTKTIIYPDCGDEINAAFSAGNGHIVAGHKTWCRGVNVIHPTIASNLQLMVEETELSNDFSALSSSPPLLISPSIIPIILPIL